MLAEQAKLPDSPFDFTDASVQDHLTGDWKEKVKQRTDLPPGQLTMAEAPKDQSFPI